MHYILQTFGDLVCPADWHVEGVFDFSRFYYVRGGTVTYSGADGTYRMRRGCLYVFPCNAYYQMTHDPEDPFDVVWFHVGLFASRLSLPVELPIEEGKLPYHLLLCLAQAMKQATGMVERLFAILVDTLGPAMSQAAVTNGELAEVLGRIGASPGEDYSNRKLAAMLGYSEKHFIRFFARHVGVQPHKYVTAMKMGIAVKHLIGGMSVKETATLLGYSSAGNFSRDFRQQYRLSPTQYVAEYSYRP